MSEFLPREPLAETPATHAEGVEKSLERQIRAFHWVRLMTQLPDRSAGSPGEREGGERIFSWMQDLGFDEVAEGAVPGSPRPGLRLALAPSLGALGCLLGGVSGFLLVAAALFSFRREERLGRATLSRLLPAPDSLNIVARAGARRPRRRVVLSASLDAPQAGRVFSHRIATLLRRPAQGESGALPWCERALLSGLLVAAASALGASGALFLLAQVLVVLGLAACAGLAFEWAFAKPAPGANDATGVAAMLTCAEQVLAQLRDDAELWLVVAGAGHSGGRGLESFLDGHTDWQAERTIFLHFDRLGAGSLHYLTSEGALARTSYPPRLRELARRLAEGGGFADVTPRDLVGETDGRHVAARGLHGLTLVALDEDGAPHRDHALDDEAASLDMLAVVRAADFGAAIVATTWRGESDPLAVI